MSDTTERIDGARLQQAMDNVAADQFARELREAIVYGPPVLAKVFSEYQRLAAAEAKNPDQVDDRGPIIGTKTWFDGREVVVKNVYFSDIYKENT